MLFWLSSFSDGQLLFQSLQLLDYPLGQEWLLQLPVALGPAENNANELLEAGAGRC